MGDKKDEMKSLEKMGEPDFIEVAPGLVLETKLRIKTQRRLERKFNLPISRIFPGKDKFTGESWDGIDFNFLDHTIKLITILAQQVNDSITEESIEAIFDSMMRDDYAKFTENLHRFFAELGKNAPKNPVVPDLAE